MFKFDLKSGYHHIGINEMKLFKLISDSHGKLIVKLGILLL